MVVLEGFLLGITHSEGICEVRLYKGANSVKLLPRCVEAGADGFEISNELWKNWVQIVDIVNKTNGDSKIVVCFVSCQSGNTLVVELNFG